MIKRPAYSERQRAFIEPCWDQKALLFRDVSERRDLRPSRLDPPLRDDLRPFLVQSLELHHFQLVVDGEELEARQWREEHQREHQPQFGVGGPNLANEGGERHGHAEPDVISQHLQSIV